MPPLATTRWAWLAMLVIQPVWFGALSPEPALGRMAAVALSTLPLLAPLWWIWRLKLNALVIGGMILLIYFCVAVAEAWVDPAARAVALAQIALITIYFVALAGVRRGSSQPRSKPAD